MKGKKDRKSNTHIRFLYYEPRLEYSKYTTLYIICISIRYITKYIYIFRSTRQFYLIVFIFRKIPIHTPVYTCLIKGNMRISTYNRFHPHNSNKLLTNRLLGLLFPQLTKYLKHYCSTSFFFGCFSFFLIVWAESMKKRAMIMNLNICKETHTLRGDELLNSESRFFSQLFHNIQRTQFSFNICVNIISSTFYVSQTNVFVDYSLCNTDF